MTRNEGVIRKRKIVLCGSRSGGDKKKYVEIVTSENDSGESDVEVVINFDRDKVPLLNLPPLSLRRWTHSWCICNSPGNYLSHLADT